MIQNGEQVLVTTEYRGVFFGTLVGCDRTNRTATLATARNCVYWPPSQKGFLGLATAGPLDGAKIGPAVGEIELPGMTSISSCTPEAVARWEAAPWS